MQPYHKSIIFLKERYSLCRTLQKKKIIIKFARVASTHAIPRMLSESKEKEGEKGL
jgi:hypothetical protein